MDSGIDSEIDSGIDSGMHSGIEFGRESELLRGIARLTSLPRADSEI